jgi:2,4-didehydro-3-deoxy-L-rhamnonate hydrolase
MKLLRYGAAGQERPGLVDKQGRVRDLSGHVHDFDFRTEPGLIARIAWIEEAGLPLVDAPARLGPPVAHVGKFIAIGLNYKDHAAEANLPMPEEPVVFMKATSCIQGANDPLVIPKGSLKTDWEVELGIVIGTCASHVNEKHALDHVAGYLVVHDVSERAFQNERGGTWDKGKGCDTFGPIGPWLVTPDEVGDPQSLELWLDVNGERMQRGNTSTMIFGCAEIVAYVSQFMTLYPRDIITTGPPPGVGMGRRPQRFLKPGDEVHLGIEKLGEQRQQVMAYRAPASLGA